jgi:hypothetical protein
VELVLNLAWLVLAATLLILYSARAPSSATEHPHLTSGLALLCIIALLFPVVSITDDLSCNPDLAESNTSKKWVTSTLLVKPLVTARHTSVPPRHSTLREIVREDDCRVSSYEFSCSNVNRRPPPLLFPA